MDPKEKIMHLRVNPEDKKLMNKDPGVVQITYGGKQENIKRRIKKSQFLLCKKIFRVIFEPVRDLVEY